MKLVRRLALLLTAPRSTLTTLAHSGGIDPLGPFALYVLVVAACNAQAVYRFAALFGEAPSIAARNLVQMLGFAARNDALLFGGAAVVAALFAHFGARPRASFAATATTASLLLVVVALQRAAGAGLAVAGHDLWWMPHHHVDGMVVRSRDGILWSRFYIKCAVSYGVPTLIFLAWLQGLWRGAGLPSSSWASSPPAASSEATDDEAPTPSPVIGNQPLTFAQRAAASLAILLLVVVGIGTIASVAKVSEQLKPALPGAPLVDAALPLLAPAAQAAATPSSAAIDSKARFSLKSLRGDVVILDFWASWCAPCRRSIPELSALQTELGARGLRVIGVNREPEDPKAGRAAWAALAPTFPTLLDDRFYGDRLGLTSLPTTYIVDREGVLRHLHLGYTDPAVLRDEVVKLLEEKGAAAQ